MIADVVASVIMTHCVQKFIREKLICDSPLNEKITLLRSYYDTERRKEIISKTNVYISSWRFMLDWAFLRTVWKLVHGYCLCYYKVFSLIPKN